MPAVPLTLVTTIRNASSEVYQYEIMSLAEEDDDDEEKQAEAVFDSNQNTAAENGLLSDSEPSPQQEIGYNP